MPSTQSTATNSSADNESKCCIQAMCCFMLGSIGGMAGAAAVGVNLTALATTKCMATIGALTGLGLTLGLVAKPTFCTSQPSSSSSLFAPPKEEKTSLISEQPASMQLVNR